MSNTTQKEFTTLSALKKTAARNDLSLRKASKSKTVIYHKVMDDINGGICGCFYEKVKNGKGTGRGTGHIIGVVLR